MTNDEIIEMARQSGFDVNGGEIYNPHTADESSFFEEIKFLVGLIETKPKEKNDQENENY